MQKFIIALQILAMLAGCSGRNNLSDAYGNFEAKEYLISAEGQGKILRLDLEEGSVLSEGEIVGYIDTLMIHLQIQSLEARIRAVESQRSGVSTQIAVQQSQKSTLLIEKARLEKLLSEKAATGKQMDDLNGNLNTLEAQILATKSKYETIESEIQTIKAEMRILRDKLRRNIIVNPVEGTVLEKFAEPFEMAVQGKTLYKIADMGTMILRVFVSGDQLALIRIGQEVSVIIDDVETSQNPLSGRVTWIAGKSEFTPKIIQTREERVNLVYAVKVEVSNDGRLKIGMPGEVVFPKQD
ncbi:HlyD family secretion protein [Bacteroidota bacterium]